MYGQQKWNRGTQRTGREKGRDGSRVWREICPAHIIHGWKWSLLTLCTFFLKGLDWEMVQKLRELGVLGRGPRLDSQNPHGEANNHLQRQDQGSHMFSGLCSYSCVNVVLIQTHRYTYIKTDTKEMFFFLNVCKCKSVWWGWNSDSISLAQRDISSFIPWLYFCMPW